MILAHVVVARNTKSVAVNSMIGLSTSSFYGKLTTEEAAEKMGSLGASCAEVFLNSFSEYTHEFLDEIKAHLGSTVFSSVHTLPTQFEPQLFAVTKRQKEDAEVFFRAVLAGAGKHGCKTYVMHGKPYFKKNTNPIAINYEAIAERMDYLCNIAGEYGVEIGLENVHWAMCNNIGFIKEMRRLVPQLRYTLDIKQANLSGDCWEEYITAFSDRLINVHICDYVDKATCLPGRGQVDFKKLAASLKAADYKGNVIVEVYDRDYDTFEELAESVAFCKEIFEG